MLSFKKTYTLPFKHDIPNYSLVFLAQNSSLLIWLKYKKRQLFIKLKHQKFLEISQILPSHKKILWINISAPSLGDSLMDLSSRVMLEDRSIDLFTDSKNVDLYKDDKIFRRVFKDENQVFDESYDLVIIDSYSSRSIRIKSKIAYLTPFVGIFGYYNGPEVNRILFSFHRLNQLLGYIRNKNEIAEIARASISISDFDQTIIQNLNLPISFVAIAIGGEWDYRIYKKWSKVIKLLLTQDANLKIVIVGSANAVEIVSEILENFNNQNIFNCVAKFTFNQTAQIISQARLLLCCDGGLMHAANAVGTPVVPLFSRLSSKMQLTDSINNFSLFDKEDVNNISEKKIIQKYNELITFFGSHL